MKKTLVTYILILLSILYLYAQVGINTINPKGIFHVDPMANTNSTGINSSDDFVILSDGNIGIGTINPTNKLHIVTSENPLRIESLKSGVTSDSLMSITTEGVVRKRSVYSLRKNMVEYPSPENNIFEGMFRYNYTSKHMEYYNGTEWQTIEANVYGGHNEGVVKILSGVQNSRTQFTFTSQNINTFRFINFTPPLSYLAFWPDNIQTPIDSDIIRTTPQANSTYIENYILGQVTTWRVILDYSAKTNGAVAFITIRLRNPVSPSTFQLQQTLVAPNGTTSGSISANFFTIADNFSLVSPFGTGNGYTLEFTSDTPLTISVNSVTRISNYKD